MPRRKLYVPKQPRPTLDDVAERAGVSTATVSRTLNSPDKVRKDTRERVTRAVDSLGYAPHFGAQYLASNRTNTVGAIIPTMDNAIFAKALQSLQEALAHSGNTLLVATSHYDQQEEEAQIRTLLARGVDGLVLIGQVRSPEVYEMLESRGVPYVLMWTHPEESAHPSVGFSNVTAARRLAAEVISLGHRRIAMIAGFTDGNDRATERVRGVRSALGDVGVPLAPPYYCEVAYSFEESAEAAQVMFALPEPPSVVMCGNDVIAAGVLRVARGLGIRVPEMLSVVGFDDIDLAEVVDPPLTTVRVPHRRMGAAAADMLIRQIKGARPVSGKAFDAPIVWRNTLGPYRGPTS